MGPREPHSTVLIVEQVAMIVAFRRQTLLPLVDCIYALQPSIPNLTRSSLHRCLKRHGISHLPETDGKKPGKKNTNNTRLVIFTLTLPKFAPKKDGFIYSLP